MLLRISTPRNRHQITIAVIAASLVTWLLATPAFLISTGTLPGASDVFTKARSLNFGNLPLQFEANGGQTDSDVRFLTRTPGGTFHFTRSGVMLAIAAPSEKVRPGSISSTGMSSAKPDLRSQHTQPGQPDTLRLLFIGANPKPEIESGKALPGTVSYFQGGDSAGWQSGLPTFAGITYNDLYPGVDLNYDGTRQQLKGTYILTPGADPTQIRWRYDGANNVTIDAAGNLIISVNKSTLTESAPVAWQEIGGKKREVEARYAIAADSSVGFTLGSYDPSQPLVIDPTLTYSSYLGGSFDDNSQAIAVDSAGNVYVTGATQADPFALGDLFVTKINADGTAVLYTTYLRGNDYDVGYGIVVDGAGNAYVTGESYSTDFPTVNAFQTEHANANDAILFKLNPSGSALVYSTYIGGFGSDQAWAIAIDAAGSAYITGVSGSTDFPLANPFQSERIGTRDVIVTKFTPDGQSLVYSTYLGGISGYDVEVGYGIVVDVAGSAYVTGYTDVPNFPLQNPIQGANGGFSDSFVTKFAPSGTSLTFSTYLGGDLNDIAYDITLDGAANAYVAGYTTSTNFPVVNPYQPVKSGFDDVFVTKINSAGSAWLYSTYLGGIGPDGQYNTEIEVAADGSMVVAGDTHSSDFPVGNWVQQFHADPTQPDIFVTHFAPSGAELIYSTFLGGAPPESFVGYPSDIANGLVLDADRNAYITGRTNSPNWPIAGNPFQPSYGGGPYDGLVAKIDQDPLGSPVPPAPTPGPCATTDYLITESSGAQIVPGTVDIGNHCILSGCVTGINLPFPFTLYDRTFTSAYVDSGGTLGFLGNQGYGNNRCLPQSDPQNLNFGIMAYWDYVETSGSNCPGGPCGIYTSVSGTAPNRIFNIEWRVKKYISFQNYDPVHFEIRLYENSSTFEVIYGVVSQGGSTVTAGVQRDTGSRYTQYSCNMGGLITPGLKLIYALPLPCGQITSTPGPSSPTATRTASAISTVTVPTTQTALPTGTRTSTAVGTPQASVSPTVTPSPTCGPSWMRVDSPSPNNIRSYLYDVEVLAPNNIWAVGVFNTSFGLDETLILHWDGTVWSQVSGPSLENGGLYSISAISPNDIWAVGYHNPDELTPYQPLTIHWNGSAWSFVPSPGNPKFENTLQGVGAVSTNDVWAVGENENGPMIMRWDGISWAIVPHPAMTPNGRIQTAESSRGVTQRSEGTGIRRTNLYWDSLNAVEVVSANDVWAVGALGDNTLAMHWNGTEWAIVTTPNPYSTGILSGITIVSASDIWAVGHTDFYLAVPRAITLHWDGQAWSNVQTPGGNLVLNDVAALSANEIWAVGHEVIDDFHTGAVLLRRSGTQWVRVPSPNPVAENTEELYGIAVSGSDEAWAVGIFDGGTLVDRYLNLCGTPMPTVTAQLPTPTGTTVATTPTSTAVSTTASTATAIATSIASSTAIATSTVTACAILFSDVPQDHTFYANIMCLACRGIVSGYSDGTFRPNSQITRGQLAKIVSNSAGFSEPPTQQAFEDVTPSSTFYVWVERLTVRGYMTGYSCGGPGEPCTSGRPYFRPFANATRGQTSKIIANAAGFTEPPSGQTFEDVPSNHTFYEFIQRLATRNVMGGYTCGGAGEPCISGKPYFRPGNDITRGQASKIVANTFFPVCQITGGRRALKSRGYPAR